MQAIDHAAGYLLAFGISTALCKTVTEGGSWEVRVSLAAVGMWIRSLGQLDPIEAFGRGLPLPKSPDVGEIRVLTATYMQSSHEGPEESSDERNIMVAVKHAATLSRTPVREEFAPMRLDASRPVWK